MLGYFCAYYRCHYPLEFLTSYLNNAANEDDIRNGTAYAQRVGIKVTMPKWGLSKEDYFFDTEKRTISKGLSSIKYLSKSVSEELYNLAHQKTYTRFMDILKDINRYTSVNSRQLDILIKIDFFSEFGNQRELLRMVDIFDNLLNKGQAKKISKEKVDGTPLEAVINKYSVGVTKSGGIAKSYTILDVDSIMYEVEDIIKSLNIEDLTELVKIQNFIDVAGYVGYVSGKDEDRRKLYVLDMFPVVRRKDNKQFGYSVVTKSIGSGKESRFTVLNRVYNKEPFKKGNLIYCKSYSREGQYFQLTDFNILM